MGNRRKKNPAEGKEFLVRQLTDRASAAAKRFERSVWPIFAGRPDRPDFVGSGVLLRLGDRRFLLTAAHVLDEHDISTLAFPTGNNQQVQIRFYKTPLPPSGKRSEDRLDVGVVVFDGDPALEEYGGVYLGRQDIDPFERPIYDLPDRSDYMVLGYPASKTRISVKKQTVKTEHFNLTTGPMPLSTYSQLGMEEESHLILRFDSKRRIFSTLGARTAPLPRGMSGCGIWRYDPPGAQPGGKLVAIFTEWLKSPVNALIGYRISEALAAILGQFPELGTKVEPDVPGTLQDLCVRLRAMSSSYGPGALVVGFEAHSALIWADDPLALDRLQGLTLVRGQPLGVMLQAEPEGETQVTNFKTLGADWAEGYLVSLVSTYRHALTLRPEDRWAGTGLQWPGVTPKDFRSR